MPCGPNDDRIRQQRLSDFTLKHPKSPYTCTLFLHPKVFGCKVPEPSSVSGLGNLGSKGYLNFYTLHRTNARVQRVQRGEKKKFLDAFKLGNKELTHLFHFIIFFPFSFPDSRAERNVPKVDYWL